MQKILIADDEQILRMVLAKELKMAGHEVVEAEDGDIAVKYLREMVFDLVVTDMKMPKKDGMEVLKAAKSIDPQIIVIIITGYASIDNAVNIMKMGADDYIVKPFDNKDFVKNIQQLLKTRSALKELPKGGRQELEITDRLIGSSQTMDDLRKTIQKVKDLKVNVLITGESGTGKGVIAKEIHRVSENHAQPFVHLDCSSLNPNLIESELFGSEKGAFTSSYKTQIGKIELAGHGTLFLDEIGNLSLDLQSKLLLVIEERYYYRVGGTKRQALNARIIAATNSDLETMMEKGEFREDLYYRLNVINIEVPPLRYRKDDIALLINGFIRKSEIARQKEIYTVDDTFSRVAYEYDWPGNVRELENAVESALALCEGNTLTAKDIPMRILNKKHPGSIEMRNTQILQQNPAQNFAEDSEIVHIKEALDRFDGHREKTAAFLGISRRTLQYKLKKYNLI